MTIPRTHTWVEGEEVFPSQVDTMDNHITYELDKREGFTDTLASDITVSSDGYVDFQHGSKFIFESSTFTTADGYLKVQGEIRGDPSANDPLRFGIITMEISNVSDLTLDKTQYNLFTMVFVTENINLTGNLKTIKFPDKISLGLTTASYTKLIDNQSNVTLACQTVNGSKVIDIFPGEKYIIYCDGVDLNVGASYLVYGTIVDQQKANTSVISPGTSLFSTISSTFLQDVTGLGGLIFTDVQDGDLFDISVSAHMSYLENTNIPTIVVSYAETVSLSINNGLPSTSDLANNSPATQYLVGNSTGVTFVRSTQIVGLGNGTFGEQSFYNRAIYTAPNTPINGTYTFYINYASLNSGSSVTFKAPISLSITQYRFQAQ